MFRETPGSRRCSPWLLLLLAALTAFAPAEAWAQAQTPPLPEAPDAVDLGRPLPPVPPPSRTMAIAANPMAAAIGRDILRAGGTATDAAIAMALALNVVEPQSSGLGGGGFWIHAAPDGTVTTLDGRETAPASSRPEQFLAANGEPLAFPVASTSGLAVGVPGMPALLAEARRRWGVMEWPQLAAPAIALAEHGFPVSPRLAGQIRAATERALAGPGPSPARRLFLDASGQPLPAGAILRQPDLAASLTLLAESGPEALTQGPVAEEMLAVIQAAGGAMTAEDLSGYRVRERPALCRDWREVRICGMGPPSSGTVAVLQILGMLEALPPAEPRSPAAWHQVLEASKLAFADRARWLGDADFVAVPVEGLLDPGYLRERATLIGPLAMESAEPGMPPGAERPMPPKDASADQPGTTHLIAIDAAGSIVSLTATIESGFGSGLMAGGFLLNNELTDFSFKPADEAGRPTANRVQPGKRPRSSMTPLIVLRDGRPVAALGSPGGSQIIGYVLNALLGVLAWGETPVQSVHAGHLLNRNGATEVEAGTEAVALGQRLQQEHGHVVTEAAMISGLGVALRTESGWIGGADPRREGLVLGD